MARIRTPLCELLGIRVPVIQAPMAGGPSCADLVVAVSEAGALGSFGFAVTQPRDMKDQVAAVREKTQRPFCINLLASPQPAPIDLVHQTAALAALGPWYAEMGLPAPEAAKAPYAPELEGQLAVVAEVKPAVFTVHLGEIEKEWILRFKRSGIRVGVSATCVAEAEHAQALGCDFVVAQGGEAGGHRGSYMRDAYEALTGTLALTRLVVRAAKVPVVAAGGIMDGAGIAAALSLGAQGVQMGTAFIPCPESGAPQFHKRAILEAKEDATRVTEKFSGKPARGIANRFLREAEAKHFPQIAYPAHYLLSAKLRQASAKADNPDFYPLWSGQAAPLARALPAAELVAQLEQETIAALRASAAFIEE